MNYGNEILFILSEAGERGLSVKKIARHVFNNCNNLFSEIAYGDVYRQVACYLSRNSRAAGSIVERTDVRGVYRLNPTYASRQLQIEFKDECRTDGGTPACEEEDKSLSLF